MIPTIKYYGQLLKFRLSSTVVFSAISGYLLGVEHFSIHQFMLLIIGGFFVTGSANGFNQIIEKNHDKLMTRTCTRPLPMTNLTISSAFIFSSFIGLLGLYLLNFINPNGSYFGLLSKSSFFGLISIIVYVLIYTPLKRKTSLSVFVGAFPGAIPFLLGWVASTDYFGLIGGVLFAIQFFWQFPHFIAIAWIQDEEYKKAGFKMIFGGKKNWLPSMISILTSLIMTFISIIPFFWNFHELQLSQPAATLILILGLWFTSKSIILFRKKNDQSAKKLMNSSFVYLPLMQLIFILDKFIRIV